MVGSVRSWLAVALVASVAVPGTAGADGKGAKKVPPPTTRVGAPPPPVEREAPDLQARPPVEAHKEGEYGGVTPGQKPSPPPAAPKHKHPPTKGTLSWIGFEAQNGGAQVFLQSPGAFEIAQHLEGATLVIYATLPRLGQNTWRQVDTRYFDNPLSSIVARQVGAAKATKDRPAHAAGVEIRIGFKNPKDARAAAVRTATEADQMFYTYLAFPEGTGTGGKAEPTMKDPEPEK